MNPRLLLMLTLPPLLWACNAIVGKIAAASIAPFLLNTLRWAVALAVLLPFVLRPLHACRAELRRHWRFIAWSGFWGITCYNALQYLALRTSSPINVTLIAAATPIFALIVGRLGFGARIHRLSALGALVSLAGVAWIMLRGDPGRLGTMHFVPGDLCMLAATMIWSLYTWMLRRKPTELTPSAMMAAQIAVGLILGLPFTLLEYALGAEVTDVAWGWREAAIVLYVGLLPSLVAYFCWQRAVARTSAQLPVFFQNLTPLFAVLLSASLLGEYPQPYHGVGLVLIIGGIILAQASGKTPARPQAAAR